MLPKILFDLIKVMQNAIVDVKNIFCHTHISCRLIGMQLSLLTQSGEYLDGGVQVAEGLYGLRVTRHPLKHGKRTCGIFLQRVQSAVGNLQQQAPCKV